MALSKRKSTQDSLVLVLEILKRIPKHRKITALEIREQLEAIGISRDIRTIQRNLEMLSEHFAIDRDTRSKPYGYSFERSSHTLGASSLNAHESLLLALAEKHLKLLLPKDVMQSLRPHFTEAKYNLEFDPKNHKDRVWKDKIKVVTESQPLLAPKIDNKVLESISKALYEDRLLTVTYHNANKQVRTSTVMPLGLAQQGVRLYLVCRFEGFNNERSLAVHRINDAIVSSFNFKRPESFSLAKYDSDGRFGFGEGESCQVQFDIDKQAGYHLVETPLSEDQAIEELESTYRVSATVIDSFLLDKWLKSFGTDVCNIYKKKGNSNVYSAP
ncbi:WYL domain-containing protein [Vibrio crassostreae]|uniref:helix-turn-helix transcriptional regulator n=1 Tax=Vibrio TaxID=662 RepID=UPI000C84EED8|nr:MULTISPECIES: WYL domain-containing protein [Vibrio]CAK2219473.1 WYL domain-containing protein [Vibrio crassostreae]CAK2384205.1 WYL domain-containing protein [Vibrio crassostreae]CAK2554745.1 WYL domain-containing protein [Vibrio crassostreae]CAK3010207.1 WYL domain-containing protein [Vibrio crassostreae]CAK3012619.1 WYL domain-containing protein [Vibrio crassostreae]